MSDNETFARAESFFAQDAWDGAEPFVIAVAFAEAENSQLRSELSTLRGVAEEMEYNLKNITALLKAYHKLIPDQRALMEIAEAESALARYQEVKK